MATHTDIQTTVSSAPADVHAALSSPEFWTYFAEHLSTTPGEVNQFNNTDNGVEVVLYEVMAKSMLPENVQALIKNDLNVKRTIRWTGLEGDTASAVVQAEIKGAPVSYNGTQKLSGDAASTLDTALDVSVNIPFMGAAMEPKVVDALKQLYAREAEVISEYLAQ